MQQTPLPAYGRELLELRRRGLVPNRGFLFAHVVVCLDHWKLARAQTRLVVPPESDPAALDFSMLAGLDVLLVYQSRVSTVARRDVLIRQVLRYGPSDLVAFDITAPAEWFVVRSATRGVVMPEFAT